MADPLSIAASIAGLVTLGAQVSTQIYTLINNIKDAPDTITSLKEEVESFHSVLEQLKDTLRTDFNDVAPFSGPVRESLGRVLESCRVLFKRIGRLMGRFGLGSDSTRWEQLVGKLQFVFREQDVLRLLRSLEACKGTISISLLMLLMRTTGKIDQSIQDERLINLTLVRKHTAAQLDSQSSLDSRSRSALKSFLNSTTTNMTDVQVDSVAFDREKIPVGESTNLLKNDSETELEEMPDKKPQRDKLEVSDEVPGEEAAANVEEHVDDVNMEIERKDAIVDKNGSLDQSLFQAREECAAELQRSDESTNNRSLSPLAADNTSQLEIKDITKNIILTPASESAPTVQEAANLSKTETENTPSKPTEAEQSFGEPLLLASTRGDLPMVELMLSLGADVNFVSASSQTALQLACWHSREEVVSFLLSRGADPNLCDPLLRTVSHLGTPAIALLLLKAGANATPTAMNIAASHGNPQTVTNLLDYKAEVNSVMNNMTALCHAAMQKHEAVVTRLLSRGGDPNLCDPLLRTVTHLGTPEIALLLLKAGAVPTPTALSLAASNGNAAALNYLLDFRADVNSIIDHWTSLCHAAMRGHEAAVSLLLSRGADPNLCTPLNGTVTHRGTPAIAAILLKAGAVATPEALKLATVSGNTAAAKLLIEAGVNVNEPFEDGQTALWCTALHGRDDTARMLLDNGADWRVGNNPLLMAVGRGHLGIVKELVKRGAKAG